MARRVERGSFRRLTLHKFHLHFLADYMAHILLSLWGVYLVRSGQVSVTRKNALSSGGIVRKSANDLVLKAHLADGLFLFFLLYK